MDGLPEPTCGLPAEVLELSRSFLARQAFANLHDAIAYETESWREMVYAVQSLEDSSVCVRVCVCVCVCVCVFACAWACACLRKAFGFCRIIA